MAKLLSLNFKTNLVRLRFCNKKTAEKNFMCEGRKLNPKAFLCVYGRILFLIENDKPKWTFY